MKYLSLFLIIGALGVGYLTWPPGRLGLGVAIGLSYFAWGVWYHWQRKTLHRPIVLEYLSLALLAMTLLIFMSLRV